MTDSARPLEVLIGRSLASCIHPVAAWRTRSTRWRAVLVGSYLGAGYAGVLLVLLLL
jgi:hypothetical protein